MQYLKNVACKLTQQTGSHQPAAVHQNRKLKFVKIRLMAERRGKQLIAVI
jgi:hypothetical protein